MQPLSWNIERHEAGATAARVLFAFALLLGSIIAGAYFVGLTVAATEGAPRLSCERFGHPTPLVDGEFHPAHRNGTICFALDSKSRNPAWAMTLVSPQSLAGDAVRGDRFYADERVPKAWRVTPSEFEHTPFARGHLMACGYFGDQAQRDASFAMTNMGPQNGPLNSGYWAREVEGAIQRRVREEGLAAVPVVALIYPRAREGKVVIRTVGKHDVWVPERWACAVLYVRDGRPENMAAWIVPNEPVRAGVDYSCSVDEFEEQTGWDVYPALDDELEERLEAAG